MTWHVIRTEPQRELSAAERLRGQGLEPYVPVTIRLMRNNHYRHRSYREIIRAMFPGYVFVRDEPGLRWGVINATHGILGALRFGETMATVSDAGIDAVKCIEREWRNRKPHRWGFKIGDRVRINRHGHAFDGHEGILQTLDRHDQVVVSLMMPGLALTPSIRVRTDAQWITAVEPC